MNDSDKILVRRQQFIMQPNEIFKVTEEERQRIHEACGKSEEEINKYLDELTEWLKTQPHIPQDQDEILLRTIMGLNKFKIDKVKKKLDMFYAIRNIVPDFYKDRSPLTDQMQIISKQIPIFPLPNLMNSQRIYVARFTEVENAVSFDVLALARLLFLMYDLRVHYDPAPEEVFIVDLQYMRLHHVIRMSPLIITRIYSVLEKAYSDRIKGVHFINIPRVANIFVTLVKYVLNFKLANRVHTHKDLKSLNEAICKENLPSNYGGTLKSLEEIQADWQNFMESRNDWLVEQGNKKTNEKLRPESSKSPGMFSSLLHVFQKQKISNEAPL